MLNIQDKTIELIVYGEGALHVDYEITNSLGFSFETLVDINEMLNNMHPRDWDEYRGYVMIVRPIWFEGEYFSETGQCILPRGWEGFEVIEKEEHWIG